MNINGHGGGHPLIGQKPQRRAIDMTEVALRSMIDNVKKQCEDMGGMVPSPDPAGLLAVGIILDKLNAITKRLDKIEEKMGTNGA